MSTKVIASLITWDRATRPKQQARHRAGAEWVKQKLPLPAEVGKRDAPRADREEGEDDSPRFPETEWVTVGTRNRGGSRKTDADAVASCKVIRFDGDEAECAVKLLDFEMPSVSLPASVLRANNLKEGDRFFWIMRESGPISSADIDPEVPRATAAAQLSAAERAELAELFEDSRRREREGEEWEEYTGDGR